MQLIANQYVERSARRFESYIYRIARQQASNMLTARKVVLAHLSVLKTVMAT